jgi:hypothetical protein
MTRVSMIAKLHFEAGTMKEIDLGYLTLFDDPFKVVVTPKASSKRKLFQIED